jgi:hypothetical protein
MVFTFAGTIANWIDDDWQMIERMVNFYHIQDKDHEGEWAAKAFVNTAAERGGLDKMSIIYLVVMNQTDSRCLYFLALCMDNASVCDVLARSAGVLLLQKYGLQFHPQNARIRCMAHVVNLIVQAILAELNEANDPEQDDYYIPNKHIPFHYDPDDDEEVQQMENEEAEEDGGEDDDEEFVELLHMNLEDKELEGALDSVVDLSEVKKVRIFSNAN